MVVYILCAGGATSSLLCSKIKNASKGKLKLYFDSINNVILNLKDSKLNEYDIILGYGPSGAITSSYIEEYDIQKYIDLILISPQVSYDLERITRLMSPYNIKAEVIDMKTFGTMDGSKVLDNILNFKK